MLNPYLPITAISLQRPLSSVPKVGVVERFDYGLLKIGDCKHLSTTKQSNT